MVSGRLAARTTLQEETEGRGTMDKNIILNEEVRSMTETEQTSQLAATMERLDAEWERRKAKLLRSLTETPLDRWLRRRR